MFTLFRKKEFFTHSEQEAIVAAIKEAEVQTSGEVRVYVESRCRFVDPLDRAAEVFWALKMDQTEQRNAVLVYLAVVDHQVAIMGDEGIHQKVGDEFWRTEVSKMITQFRKQHYAEALVQVIKDAGEALKTHFPYDRQTDKNELPDDIIFGQ